jgi:NAD(P)-dependent dehydrogenase (short-subunit alcohol dehydrogenase family)
MGDWALILGASSGFGEATALALAQAGFDIFGVHLDRRQTMPNVERITGQIKDMGREVHYFNGSATDAENRTEVLDQMQQVGGGRPVRVLLHSLAFGAMKPFVAEDAAGELSQRQMEMTLDVMANSLVYWAQDLVRRQLLRDGGRIFAMTSSGSTRAIPTYGAVSAAKAALEAHIRQLALELAPLGITANAIRAGVTDTPALRQIPGNEILLAEARKRNPAKRLTTPRDIGAFITLMASPASQWVSGNVIGVDGGEEIAGA